MNLWTGFVGSSCFFWCSEPDRSYCIALNQWMKEIEIYSFEIASEVSQVSNVKVMTY